MFLMNLELNSKVLSLFSIPDENRGLSILFLILFYFSLFSAFVVLSIFLVILISDQLLTSSFCFTNECFQFFFKRMSSVRMVFQGLLGIFAVVGTIGVLFVALLSYLASERTAKFTNYISHLSLFRDYFYSEVAKLDALSLSSFDTQKLYNFIFPDVKNGLMSVSSSYKEFIDRLNREIYISNQMASNAQNGTFRYNEHQQRMRLALSEIGFDLPIQPKSDFYEIETQLILMIDSISISFCGLLDLKLIGRTYR
ncbi:hypothetical protein LCGC14_1150710 [marine sediment metagenome]|uniref:Uncharacterized protein n=1 Tax=marine sediment metagenome TaxID=412755 RepID=A0A0F9LVI5_9ZZZZ